MGHYAKMLHDQNTVNEAAIYKDMLRLRMLLDSYINRSQRIQRIVETVTGYPCAVCMQWRLIIVIVILLLLG